MIGSPDLYRSWKEFGTQSLDEVERYARSEFRDGDLSWLRDRAPPVGTAPSLRERIALALHLRPAKARVPAPSASADVRSGVAAIHFAAGRIVIADASRHAAAAAFMVRCREDAGSRAVECLEP